MTAVRGPRPSLVVELAGPPGSGKTTLAGELAAALRSAGVGPVADVSLPAGGGAARARRLARKLGHVAATAGGRPGDALRTWRAARRAGLRGREALARAVNLVVLGSIAAAARRRAGVHVLDQGVVQELASVGATGRWEEVLPAALPRRGRWPDLVVLVGAPPDDLVRRLRARPGRQSRLERLDDDGLRAGAVRTGELLRAVLAASGTVVVDLPNGDGAPGGLQPVVAAIAGLAVARAQTTR